MSEFGDIATALAAVVRTALPAYDHSRFEGSPYDGYIAPDQVPVDARPFALMFNPEATASRLDYQQAQNLSQFSLLLLRDASDAATMRADVEALKLAIERSGGLTATVQDAYVSEWGVDETRPDRVTGGLVAAFQSEVS